MTVTTNPFSHLEMSKNADSIYYADLFKINNKICMITGFGKSQAARIAINKNNEADIARDLSDVQSQNFYLENPRTIEEVNNNFIAIHLNDFHYTGSLAKYFCSPNQYNWLLDIQRRYDCFLELTNNITTTQFVVVPWMATVEEKALLYTAS